MSLLEMGAYVHDVGRRIATDAHEPDGVNRFVEYIEGHEHNVADVRAAEARLDDDLAAYTCKVYWLFWFVARLKSLMDDPETSLHGAIMREISFDSITGQVAVVVNGCGPDTVPGLNADSNQTAAFVYAHVPDRHALGLVTHRAVCTTVCVSDVRAYPELVTSLEDLMGVPNDYMCRMVDLLDTMVDGDDVRVLPRSQLDGLHSKITTLAVQMCEQSAAKAMEFKRCVSDRSVARIVPRSALGSSAVIVDGESF